MQQEPYSVQCTAPLQTINWKFWPRKKIWQMVKASLRSSNSVFSTSSWLQINYRVSGICQAFHPRVPWTSPSGCLTEQLPTFCITTLHFSYEPPPISSYWAPAMTPWISAFRTTGLIVRGSSQKRGAIANSWAWVWEATALSFSIQLSQKLPLSQSNKRNN